MRCGDSGFFAVQPPRAGGGVRGLSSWSVSSVELMELPEIEPEDGTRADCAKKGEVMPMKGSENLDFSFSFSLS
jgi:hypothetical protein